MVGVAWHLIASLPAMQMGCLIQQSPAQSVKALPALQHRLAHCCILCPTGSNVCCLLYSQATKLLSPLRRICRPKSYTAPAVALLRSVSLTRTCAVSCVQATKSLSQLEKAIEEARKQCDEATAGECAAAWDTVEELSAAIAHKKAAVSAPHGPYVKCWRAFHCHRA